MASHRFGTRRSRPRRTYHLRNRDGLYLHDASREVSPLFRWTKREAMAAGFPTRDAARSFVRRHFGGETAAREVAGIHVVESGTLR